MSAIKMENITKKFGNFIANNNINIEVQSGEVHAILGENGAGKSTLMNILFGLYNADSGKIYINDQEVTIKNPTDAQKYHLGMVHQHFKLVDTFTVLDNIILGNEQTKGIILDKTKARQKIIDLIKNFNFDLDVDDKIANLTVGQKQKVEILKVLYTDANIIIFDEPTAVLTPEEVKSFLEMVRKFKEENKTIILITHKLAEIKAVAQTCTIIRKGEVVGNFEVPKVTEYELANLMVGEELHFVANDQKNYTDDEIINIQGIEYTNELGIKKLKGLNLTVNKGEILGIAGVDNNGQKELVDILTRVVNPDVGEITFNKNKNLLKTNIKVVNDGMISHIPEDRIKNGIVPEYDVAENAILKKWKKPRFSKFGFLKKKEIYNFGQEVIDKYDVRSAYGIKSKVEGLSGGNQQKLVIGREIEMDADVIIAFQPTRGVDVGAINFIHEKLIEQRNLGKAIILISMELSEVMALSDKIAVLHDGEIIDNQKAQDLSRNEIGLMMAGQRSTS